VRFFLNAVKSGFAEIRRHKIRSALSFMAIAAGAVVFIDSSASIFSTYDRLQKQKEVSGIARLKISPNNNLSFSNPEEYTPPPVITYGDAVSLKNKLPGLYMVSPENQSWRNTLEYKGKRVVTTLAGITPEWAKRDFTYTLKGRFLDWRDVENKLRVCVLVKKSVPPPASDLDKTRLKQWDYTAAFDILVSHNDLLGEMVKIDGVTFTVIGVLEEPPASKQPDLMLAAARDYKILAPVTTLLHYGFTEEEYDSMEISVDAGNENNFDESLRLIRNFLKVRFGGDEYFLIDNRMETLKEMIETSVKDSLMIISLGMLAFLAGGIGIMNVTLATVFARTKEIGIRRALGANRGDIMMQFIVEAVMLGLIGGALGSVAGCIWGSVVKEMLGMEVVPIKVWLPVISMFIAAFTALVFAIYPAWVAAGLKPADALRAE
jgi:putative ABC transport system permease protein